MARRRQAEQVKRGPPAILERCRRYLSLRTRPPRKCFASLLLLCSLLAVLVDFSGAPRGDKNESRVPRLDLFIYVRAGIVIWTARNDEGHTTRFCFLPEGRCLPDDVAPARPPFALSPSHDSLARMRTHAFDPPPPPLISALNLPRLSPLSGSLSLDCFGVSLLHKLA